ncbi:MAG: hypothetical protein JWO05_920 [Gemmatimonadetes bacterium]|nr:hypothetical protein [Gemmatimonadota bacterium]
MRPRLAPLLLLAAVAIATPARAQRPQGNGGITDAQVFFILQNMPPESARPLGSLINALLSDTLGHMKMMEPRMATAADSARAAHVVEAMRASLSQYRDVAVAERDGYALFLPWLDEQVIYHYNNMRNAGLARTAFDATKPTSLLYRKDAKGNKELVGAMYTAPVTSTPEELDARLPLGIAGWHSHVNFCAMPPAVAQKGVMENDSSTFLKWIAIDTPDACKAAGGLFVPQLFGWMAHVNAFVGDAPGAIWGSAGRDHMHMHHEH